PINTTDRTGTVLCARDILRRSDDLLLRLLMIFFFFNDTAPTEIYTLSLHDALPISPPRPHLRRDLDDGKGCERLERHPFCLGDRSEEHTSELQSRGHLVCRLLLEKKKK